MIAQLLCAAIRRYRNSRRSQSRMRNRTGLGISRARAGYAFSILIGALCLSSIPWEASHASVADARINEFVANHTGTDTFEFVEVFGTPASDYSSLTILEIEGDGSGSGMVDGVFAVGTTDAAGFWTTGYLNNLIENGTMTLLLVSNFTGAQGADLDTDNNGTLDVTPFDAILDDVAVSDGGASDHAYSSSVLTPGYDGIPLTPGGGSRIPNGTDTGAAADWVRNDFDGEGLPGFTGTPSVGEALNTPGSTNKAVTPPPDPVINEFVANHVGADTHEFIEIFGAGNTNYSRFTVLEIEGDDAANSGRIDDTYAVGTTDAGGFWKTSYLTDTIENGSLTFILVENFTGFVSQDLDANDDGVLDFTPFGRVVDDVGISDGGASDHVYSAAVLATGFDGVMSVPGGASRIPNATDTNAIGDWLRNDFDGDGLPGFVGTPVYGEAHNTPGFANDPVADTTPPVIVVDLSRTVLWPPNHKMVEVCAEVTVTDNADPAPTFVLTSVSSSEPDNDKGDGNTKDDIQGDDIGMPDLCIDLRAERQGGGPGREYTIVYTATDASGNTASMTVAVRVPHDESGWAMASTGFLPDGTALDETQERFALVIPSRLGEYSRDEQGRLVAIRDGYDATQIDVHRLFLGNGDGVLRPLESLKEDVNHDGLRDMALIYRTSDVLAAQSQPSAEIIDGDVRNDRKPVAGPIGLHYESPDGTEYLVPDIFGLGPVDRLVEIIPLGSEGDRSFDGAATPAPTARVVVQPNPFNPTTMISVELGDHETLSVRVYDLEGRLVRTLEDKTIRSGHQQVSWDGRDSHGQQVASGIYFVRVETTSFRTTVKAVMLK